MLEKDYILSFRSRIDSKGYSRVWTTETKVVSRGIIAEQKDITQERAEDN